MVQLTVIFWRDIPAQVVVEEGRGRGRRQAKCEMPRRFALAIDEAAMRGDAAGTDDYLSEWRKSEAEAIEGAFDDAGLEAAASGRVAELDAAFDAKRLAALVANGGRQQNSQGDSQGDSQEG